jgi:putative ABC transport system ATP-binding protein
VNAALELRSVTHTYGSGRVAVTALEDVSLAVGEGELVCVLGPSGCGKSSLLAVAAGLEAPGSGEVLLHGDRLVYGPASTSARLRNDVGFVFQELNLLRDLSAVDNVALALELRGVPSARATVEATEALATVGAAGLAEMFPGELSRGEEQRVAIARALVGSRRILLADEPTAALDSLAADGAAAIVATHDRRQAAIADRVVFLRDGRVLGESQASLEAAR